VLRGIDMTMERICPKGHVSSDPDYCSECGAKLGGAASAITPATAIAPEELAAATGGEPCPVCATRRVVGARFCEVCRYDFETATAPNAASAPPTAPKMPTPSEAALPCEPPAPSASPPAPTLPPSELVAQHWDIIVAVDPALNSNPDPAQPCPQNAPERTFPLDLDENLIGRRSDRKDIHPEIMVADPGISRRHLSLRRRDDGGFLAIELGSTNGTFLNAAPLEPGIPTPLKNGDQLTLGCWTRMTIRAR
jgi:pSer/pThr/pTyr-binding forkhead associated (FHA) protein